MDTWCDDPDRARKVVGVAGTDGMPSPRPETMVWTSPCASFFETCELAAVPRLGMDSTTLGTDPGFMCFSFLTTAVLQRLCPVCFVDHPEKDMLSAGCSHFVCQQCWKSYLSVNINEKQKVMRLTCPALAEGNKPCPVVAPRSLLVKVADRPILEKLADYDDAMLVESNSRVSWCSQPGCKAVAMVDRPAPKYPMCAHHLAEACGQLHIVARAAPFDPYSYGLPCAGISKKEALNTCMLA